MSSSPTRMGKAPLWLGASSIRPLSSWTGVRLTMIASDYNKRARVGAPWKKGTQSMKRLLVGITILSILGSSTLAWAQLLPHFNPGDVLHAVDLNDIVDVVNALQGETPRTFTVDCTAGNTIGQALIQAVRGDTLLVTGSCHETVVITIDGLTLDGQGTTTVDGGGQTVITVNGARRVVIKNLTVSNGLDGILVHRTAAVELQGVTAQNNMRDGIRLNENGTARLTNCTMQQNGQDGLDVLLNSSAVLSGTIMSNGNER